VLFQRYVNKKSLSFAKQQHCNGEKNPSYHTQQKYSAAMLSNKKCTAGKREVAK
jgi:hypothetical protein